MWGVVVERGCGERYSGRRATCLMELFGVVGFSFWVIYLSRVFF